MQDRFSELKGIQSQSRPDEEAALPNDEVEGGEDFMKDFFEEVNGIKAGMAVIRRNLRAIKDLSGQSVAAVGNDQGGKGNEELEKHIEATNKAAKDVRNKLKDMEKANAGLSKKDTAQARIQTNMHNTLTKKFMDLMQEYQEAQTAYKNKYRERVARQIMIVNPEATEEEIDDALETGNTQVFAQEIFRHSQAKDALTYIENRHKDIIKLEQSIQELHQLFVDMAILVETQGELIDQIEYNVNQSVAYTGEAAKQLQQASVLQRKSRKKMCILIAIFTVVLLVLGGGAIIAGVVSTG